VRVAAPPVGGSVLWHVYVVLCSGGFWSKLLWIGLVVVVELLMGFYCSGGSYDGGFSVLLVLRRVDMAQ
jgi:hypothetical protein